MQILLTKTAQGYLLPLNEEEGDKIRKYKVGGTIKADVVEMRNARFFRKWWALVKLAFDISSETAPQHEYKGQRVLPDFERFRKDVTILAGFCRPVFNARMELRLEAESLKWGSMTEDRFDKLYSATIDAILQKIIPHTGYDRETLMKMAENVVVNFA